MRPVRLPPCAAGASPRIAIAAAGSPKPGSGRPQYSSDANAARRSRATDSRHATSRGHRRQATISAASASSELSRRLLVVVRPALIPAALVLAVAVGGCSVGGTRSANTGSFTGVKGNVAATINKFSTDSSSNNATDICTNVLAQAALTRIRRTGNCKTIITNQLKTVGDFTLTIKSIHVNGANALAQVQSTRAGKKVTTPMQLVREAGGWRIAYFS